MDQRNLLIAIVLSVAILIGFQFLFEKIRPTPPTPSPAVPTQTAPATPAPSASEPRVAAPSGVGTPDAQKREAAIEPGLCTSEAVTAAREAQTREAAIAERLRVPINTPRLHGSIALTGGRIDDLCLATYHETVDPKSPEVVLLWPNGTKEPYFAEFGWVASTSGIKVPGSETR